MPISTIICYARKDEKLLNILKAHLKPLEHVGLPELLRAAEQPFGASFHLQVQCQNCSEEERAFSFASFPAQLYYDEHACKNSLAIQYPSSDLIPRYVDLLNAFEQDLFSVQGAIVSFTNPC